MQSTTTGLKAELDQGCEVFPRDLTIESLGKDVTNPRAAIELHINLCILKMVLCRPFVSQIDITNESEASTKTNRSLARQGVYSVIQMVGILSDDPVAAEVLQVLPWWSLLHYVCQATALLLLEMCLNTQHLQDEPQEVLRGLRKGMQYLWVLAPESKSAYKAWNIQRPLIGRLKARHGHDGLLDMPLDARQPQDWSDLDELQLQQDLRTIQLTK